MEACKFVYAQRTKLGDWNQQQINEEVKKVVSLLTSASWLASTAAKIRPDWTSSDPAYYGVEKSAANDAGTSHTSILAENGDAVAATSTVNTYFGSSKWMHQMIWNSLGKVRGDCRRMC